MLNSFRPELIESLYKKWLHFELVMEKKTWFWQTPNELIKYNDKLYSKEEFYESITVLFDLIERVEKTGYDISIFFDEVRIEPNIRKEHYVPPIHISTTKADCINNTYSKREALYVALMKFSSQFETYISKPPIYAYR